MTLETFQTLLSELLAKYNEEAGNHYVKAIEVNPEIITVSSLGSPVIINYEIEIKTVGK